MATFADLKTELAARGFNRLSAARQGQFINQAYHEINEQAEWPYLETVTSGTAPLTISDVRQVLYVIDTTTKVKLRPMDVEHVTEFDADFSTAGVPQTAGSPDKWWLDGMTTLRVHPANTTDTIAVRYIKNAAELTGTDTPLIPTRFQYHIVDVAQAMASAETASDDRDQGVVRAEVDRVVARMARTLLNRHLDGPDMVQVSWGGSTDW